MSIAGNFGVVNSSCFFIFCICIHRKEEEELTVQIDPLVKSQASDQEGKVWHRLENEEILMNGKTS